MVGKGAWRRQRPTPLSRLTSPRSPAPGVCQALATRACCKNTVKGDLLMKEGRLERRAVCRAAVDDKGA
jgi:hypothetical protein